MGEGRFKVLFVATHPVQYQAPVFRRLAEDPRLDILVAYCCLSGAEPMMDSGFGVRVSWDIPVLEGYPWVVVPNRSRHASLDRFSGLINSRLWGMVRDPAYDAVVVLTGYRYVTFWIVAAAAKLQHKALVFGTDAHELRSRDGRAWKSRLKSWVWPRLFGGLADVVIVPSSRSAALMRSLGVAEDRLVMAPYTVNNPWWIEQAKSVDRRAVRLEWSVPSDAPVALFCAKLQPWKRPLDALRAFAKAAVPEAHLVYAGEGPLHAELEAEARSLGVAERVRFLGFRNQSQLPSVYVASDILLLPSEHEPFGVVVNEAMLCGCPAVVSDRVGAGHDLVTPGQNGYVYACGDVEALAGILRRVLSDWEHLRCLGKAARNRMETWSPRENIQGLVRAVEKAVNLTRARASA